MAYLLRIARLVFHAAVAIWLQILAPAHLAFTPPVGQIGQGLASTTEYSKVGVDQQPVSSNINSAPSRNLHPQWLPISLATSSGYTLGENVVSYDGNPIPGADASTFLVSFAPTSPNTYAKDKNYVYWGTDAGADFPQSTAASAYVVRGADPTTFEPIYDSNESFTFYARDIEHIYVTDHIFLAAATSSFVVFPYPTHRIGVPEGFSEDQNHVYTAPYGILVGADPRTFHVIGELPQNMEYSNYVLDPIYAADASHVYYYDGYSSPLMVQNADPDTFQIAASSTAYDAFDIHHHYLYGIQVH